MKKKNSSHDSKQKMFSVMKTLNNTTYKNSATKIMAINIAAKLKSLFKIASKKIEYFFDEQ